jgi:tetratricopeptide (TPR) repeat protein
LYVRLAAPVVGFCIGVCLLFGSGVARAGDEEGKRLYRHGEELLQAGDYRAAARAFEAGYAEAPRVGFLLNIGNCYRKLGELGKARDNYRRFLERAPKGHPLRRDVLGYLRAIDEIEADGLAVEKTLSSTPATAPATSSPALLNASPGRAPAGALQAFSRPPEPVSTPLLHRWWLWTAVGGVLAAGATAFVLSQRPAGNSCGGTLGCARE